MLRPYAFKNIRIISPIRAIRDTKIFAHAFPSEKRERAKVVG